MTWFVAQTQPRKESFAAAQLARQGFDVYLPRYRRTVRHARRQSTAVMPLFPRYLFVGFDPERARWRAVNSTLGVCHLLNEGEQPLPVPTGVVEALMDREDCDGFIAVLPVSYVPGTRLEIISGSLASHVGLFQELDDRERVIVLIDMLQRPVRVTLPLDCVRSAH